MKRSLLNENDIEFNQLVWAPWNNKGAIAYWPAVILNPKEWTFSKEMKPTKNDDCIVWWLKYQTFSKVSVNDLRDFVRYFESAFSSKVKIVRRKAVADAVKIVLLANGKEVVQVSATAKNLLSVMHEVTGRERSKVLVQTKDQWKIVIPEKYHKELVDPYYSPGGNSIEIESSPSSESDDDSMIALHICDSFEISLDDFRITSPNEVQLRLSPIVDVQKNSTPKNYHRIPSTPTKFQKLMSPTKGFDEPQKTSTPITVQIVKNSIVVKSLDEEIKDIKMKHIVSRPITGNLSLLIKFPCLFCPTTTSDFGDMLKHLRKHRKRNGLSEKKMFCCSMCTFMSDVEADIWYHSRFHFDTQI